MTPRDPLWEVVPAVAGGRSVMHEANET